MLLANLIPKLTVSGATSSCNNSKSCLLNPNSKNLQIESTIRTAKFFKGKNNNVLFNNYLKKIFNTKKPDNEMGENPKSELTVSKFNSNGKNGMKPGFVFIDNRAKSGIDDGKGDHNTIVKLLESKGSANNTDVKAADETKQSCNKNDAEKNNVRLGITVKDCDVHADIKDVLSNGKRTDIESTSKNNAEKSKKAKDSDVCANNPDTSEKKSDKDKKETTSNTNKANKSSPEATKNKKQTDTSEGKSDSCKNKQIKGTNKCKSESFEKQNNSCQSYLDQIKKIKDQNKSKLDSRETKTHSTKDKSNPSKKKNNLSENKKKNTETCKSSESEKKTSELKPGQVIKGKGRSASPSKSKSKPCKSETDSSKSSSEPCKKKETPCESDPLKLELKGNLCEIKLKEPEKKKKTEGISDALKNETKPLDDKHDPCKKKTKECEEPSLSKAKPCKRDKDPCATASAKSKDEPPEGISKSCTKTEESASKSFYNPCKEKKDLCTSKIDSCQKKKTSCERKSDSSKTNKNIPCKSKKDSGKNNTDACKKKVDQKKEDKCIRLSKTKSVDNTKKTKPSQSDDTKSCDALLKMTKQEKPSTTCPCPKKPVKPTPAVGKKPVEPCSVSKTEKAKTVSCKKSADDNSATSPEYDVKICKTAPRSPCRRKPEGSSVAVDKKPVEPCDLSALEKKCLKMAAKKEQIATSSESEAEKPESVACKKSPDDKCAKATERKSKTRKTAPKKAQKRTNAKSLQKLTNSLLPKTNAKTKCPKSTLKSTVAGGAAAAKSGKVSICILGSGNWGSSIATIVGRNAKKHAEFVDSVPIYVRPQKVNGKSLTDIINDEHENVLYLKGIKLPENILAVPDAIETAKHSDVLIFVLPHEYTIALCKTLKGKIKKDAIAISLIKGFIKKPEGGLDLISDIIRRNLQIPCSVLMGANLAKDVAKGDFSEATIGCTDMQQAKILRKIFHNENFRVVVVKHAVAVEVCGALKNIVALACGFCDGLKLGNNTKAAVVRLGLMEMIRFMDEFYPGNDVSVYFESCGIADLITTCYGGRNRLVSEAFVRQNKSMAQLECEMLNGQKLQGPPTAVEVNHMLKAKNVESRFPLFVAVHQICTDKMKPAELISRLREHPEHERTMRTFMQAFKAK